MQQRKSSARHKAVTESQQGAALAQGTRGSRELKAPAPVVAPPPSSGAMTLGGHADRGLTLAALYDTGVLERLRLDVRIRLISDLTQSLAWLHANPRLMSAHRHLLIAPSTIVIGLDGVARVDVRAAKKQTSDRSELEGDYCAPEVLAGDPAADHRADIFSVGVLAWEALAGKRLSAADSWSDPSGPGLRAAGVDEDDLGDVPVALGPGRADREPVRRRAPARALGKASHSRLKTVPPLSLPEDAEWAMPFAQLALLAMSGDVSQRPQDCRFLISQLELIDAGRLATNQEIAEVVQGISAVGTLCVPEPTFPATDAVCQNDATSGLQFMDKEPCSNDGVDGCFQRNAPAPRRVAAAVLVATAPGKMTPPAAPGPAALAKAPSPGPLILGYTKQAWFVAGLLWLAVLGSLAGYVASVMSH